MERRERERVDTRCVSKEHGVAVGELGVVGEKVGRREKEEGIEQSVWVLSEKRASRLGELVEPEFKCFVSVREW